MSSRRSANIPARNPSSSLRSLFVPLLVGVVALLAFRSKTSSASAMPQGCHRILSGAFGAPDLYLLRFTPASSTLELVKTIPAKGPHQYLGINEKRDRVYATSWALPPRLSAWNINKDDAQLIDEAPITATSSYTFVTKQAAYSMGGPTGEVHAIDRATGGLGEKLQEVLFVPQADLAKEDKTRKALRYGSHAVEISSLDQAFVPHLGHNAIFVYAQDPTTSRLTELARVKSPRDHDGPRHAVVSADGRLVYSVTEHTSYVDVFETSPSAPFLSYRSSYSLLPSGASHDDYRGDTIRLSPHSRTLLATTRGATTSTKGLLVAWDLDDAGFPKGEGVKWETPTSGGKANAIEFLPGPGGKGSEGEEWTVLTDDEAGWIFIVAWTKSGSARGFNVVARCRLPGGVGASHAVWLD